jgi:hypothetical protein
LIFFEILAACISIHAAKIFVLFKKKNWHTSIRPGQAGILSSPIWHTSGQARPVFFLLPLIHNQNNSKFITPKPRKHSKKPEKIARTRPFNPIARNPKSIQDGKKNNSITPGPKQQHHAGNKTQNGKKKINTRETLNHQTNSPEIIKPKRTKPKIKFNTPKQQQIAGNKTRKKIPIPENRSPEINLPLPSLAPIGLPLPSPSV